MPALIALTRLPSPKMDECQLTFRQRTPLDSKRLSEQHAAYEAGLALAGCEIVRIPATPRLPDSVFVEDTAIVLVDVGVIMRPGAISRRPEIDTVEDEVARYRDIVHIESPGTLDGGDVLVVGKSIYVGGSTRSNRAGCDQMVSIGRRFGYSVVPVDLRGCLHLKSAATQVGIDTLLVNPGFCDTAGMKHELLYVSEAEPEAANALLVNGRVIYPASFPETADKMGRRGIELELVDVSEFQKAEAGVTCCSIVFES